MVNRTPSGFSTIILTASTVLPTLSSGVPLKTNASRTSSLLLGSGLLSIARQLSRLRLS